jgi:hypothetical protein
MPEQPLEPLTHVGWRHSNAEADADHLLIRHDLAAADAAPRADAEPLLSFINAPEPDAGADHPAPDSVADDAGLDPSPYLWGGEALAPEAPVVFGAPPAPETVFS